LEVSDVFTDDWVELSPDARFNARMDAWQYPEIGWASDEAKALYEERTQLFRDAIQLKKPKRVPIAPWVGLFPALWDGMTAREAYYDFDRLTVAWDKWHAEFKQDVLALSIAFVPCELFDVLDYRLYDWPGHGVSDTSSYQYIEKEWMKADEYDALIADPAGFWQRTYLPRVFGALEPAAMLSSFTNISEAPMTAPAFIPFGIPPVQEMLQKLMDAGRVALEWVQKTGAMDGMVMAKHGVPGFAGSATKAPYDILGDTLRGTRGLMGDKFRRPDKIIEACDRLVALAITQGVSTCDVTRNPLVFIPLHKGADGFLSDADFRKFYWPSLKAVLLGLIEQGCVPVCFAEGGYNSRLEAIHDEDIPAGRMIWMFDATDMGEAKKHLGGYQCFGGNVPGAIITTGTPQEMDDYVRQLIEGAAGDGGFILGSGINIDEAKTECVKAMIDAGLRYGAQA
jgi:hypothetical protein